MSRELLQQALDALENHRDPLSEAAGNALREALAAPQPEPEKRIVWCTETDSACSTCPTLRIPCQAATQAAALNARVTVPREPTQEMIAAGEAVFRSYCFRHVNGAIPTYEAMIAAVPAPAAPPPIDNRFVAPGCEQFGTRADAESLLTMLRATLDEYMRLAAAPAVHPDEFTCPYCFDQGAAPAVPDDIAAIIACLGDDAALLRETTDDSEEIAQNMDDAAAALERLSAAPAVREPLTDEMDAVASKYAHKLALDLECVLSDYNGKWWDTAMQTIGEYRMAMNRIHEQESPTHMGEPVLPKHGIGGGGNHG